MTWFTPFMWAFSRLLAYIFQLIGVTGLLVFAVGMFINLVERLTYEEVQSEGSY